MSFHGDVLQNHTLNKKETGPLRVRKDMGLVTEVNRHQDLMSPVSLYFRLSLLLSLSFSVSCLSHSFHLYLLFGSAWLSVNRLIPERVKMVADSPKFTCS